MGGGISFKEIDASLKKRADVGNGSWLVILVIL